jgi:hypothetical protein
LGKGWRNTFSAGETSSGWPGSAVDVLRAAGLGWPFLNISSRLERCASAGGATPVPASSMGLFWCSKGALGMPWRGAWLT